MSLWLRDQPCQKALSQSFLVIPNVRTLAGHLKTQEDITICNLRLPEFNKNRHINQQKVLVFDNDNVKYDIILGTNFLYWNKAELLRRKHGMVWLLHSNLSTWRFGFKRIRRHGRHVSHPSQRQDLQYWLQCFATEILDAKYERTDVAKVVKGLTHLNAHQKADLLQVLQENNTMFNGTLGVYPHKKVHIDIDPNAKPVHSRPFLYLKSISRLSKRNWTILLK
jgi:hypothetical protein